MNLNKFFKDIEANCYYNNNHVFIDVDDLSSLLYDLCFTKSELDVHSLRAIKRLIESIKKTYKLLLEAEEIDLNNEISLIELSRKKIKKLIDNTIKLSKADNSELGAIDSISEDLSENNTLFNNEALKEVINASINDSIEPIIDNIKMLITEHLKTVNQKTKDNPKSKSKGVIEPQNESDIENLANELNDIIK